MKEKFLTAEQIHSTKKVGDIIIMKNNLIECEITEIGTKTHLAQCFFGGLYQKIKYINFIYGQGEKLSIKSHDHIKAHTKYINDPVYGESEDWNEYYFLDGDVYKNNQKENYMIYLKNSFTDNVITEKEYINALEQIK